MLLLAGCAGNGGGGGWQTVPGPGFQFAAPAGWTVGEQAGPVVVSEGKVDRVQVQTFRLVKAYQPSLFQPVSRELDRVAEQVAGELGGRVTARATVRVDGRDARSYRIAYHGLVEEITFVLDDSHEYELLCRRSSGAPDDTCRKLVSSFRLV